MDELSLLRKKIADLEKENRLFKETEKKLRATNQQLQISEQQLKTEQETLKRTQRIAHVGSWDWDIANDKVTWSDELFRIFRLDPEKGPVSYADQPKLYTPESMQRLDKTVKHTLECGDPYKLNLEIIRGDGTIAYCIVRGFAKKDDNGKIIQLYGSFQDVSERKNTEEQLKALNQQLQANELQLKAFNESLIASEKQFRQLFENLEQGFALHQMIYDENGKPIDYRFILINKAFNQLTGINASDYIGKTVKQVLPQIEQIWIDNYGQVAKTGKSIQFEHYAQELGKYYNVTAYSPKENFFATIFTDTTLDKTQSKQLLEAKEKAEENEIKYKAAFNTNPDAITINKTDGKYVEINEGYTRLTGYTEEDVIGKLSTDINIWSNLKDREKLINGLKEFGIVENLESIFKTKDGRLVPGLISAKVITFKNEPHILSVTRAISEIKKFEQELIAAKEKAEENQANITAIIEGTNNSVWAFNRNYQLLYINHVLQEDFLQVFGILLEPGMSLVEALPKSIQAIWKLRYDRVLANEQFTIEDAVPTDDGTIYIQVTFNPIIKNGQVIGGSCFGNNITSQKLAELELIAAKEKAEESKKALNQSHDLMKYVTEHNRSAVAVHDKNFKYIYVSQSYLEDYNIKEKDIIGKHHYDVFPDLPQKWRDVHKKALLGEVSSADDDAYYKNDGSVVWTRWECRPWYENENDIGGFVVYTEVITERKNMELALIVAKEKAEESEAKFKLLNQLTSEMLMLQDMESIYTFIAENLHKHYPNALVLVNSVDEAVQQSRLEAISGLDNKLIKKIIKIAGFNPFGKIYKLNDTHNSYFKTGNFIEFNGGLAEFSASEIPVFVANAFEKLIGLHKIYTIGINRDDELLATIHFLTFNKQVIVDENLIEVFVKQAGLVMQKKINEKDLKKAKEKAEESDRLKSAFLANMSHEIRTPMNGILGFTDLLKEPKLSVAEKHHFINIIESSGSRLLNTVNDLVDFSKIEAGQMTLSISNVNIDELIEQLYTFFSVEAQKKGLHLFLDTTPANTAINIVSDKEKIYSILTNLIKNAIKYSRSGKIEFGYKKAGNDLQFFVKDNGVGIPKEKLEIIFERFVRVGNDEEFFSEGSGLGLSIAKAYVEMLGGKIWVKSEVGTGTQFYFTIPIGTAEKEPSENKDAGIETKNQINPEVSGLKILIAEDDETADALLSIFIRDISKEVLHAKSGLQAVELCRNNSDIDIVLMDINMPEMNGYEATRQIRTFNKEVNIIAQTAYALPGDQEKSLKAGCNAYISKPIIKVELLALIQQYVNK